MNRTSSEIPFCIYTISTQGNIFIYNNIDAHVSRLVKSPPTILCSGDYNYVSPTLFMPPFACARRHYVVGPSVRPSFRPSGRSSAGRQPIINPMLHPKVISIAGRLSADARQALFGSIFSVTWWPSRHKTLNQCWLNVGPTSSTVNQR